MNSMYLAASLDGFIAKKDGDVDWLQETPNTAGDDFGYGAFMAGIDAIVMGRNSFEKVLTFGAWPYDKKVFVLSTTLTEVPQELKGSVEIIAGSPKEIVAKLNALGYQELYIDGGITAQGFLAADLIDHLIITRIPIVLGSGIPLFGELVEPLKFTHEKTQVFVNALVQSHYKRM